MSTQRRLSGSPDHCCWTQLSKVCQVDFARLEATIADICELTLDIQTQGSTIDLSPPIQFRIEWVDSQEKSPLFGCRPILIFTEEYPAYDLRSSPAAKLVARLHPRTHGPHHRLRRLGFHFHNAIPVRPGIYPRLRRQHSQGLTFFLGNA